MSVAFSQVDEMKKKAIKTAGTYDEFKNLVACASQKPVDRGSLLSFTDAKSVRNTAARSSGAAGASVTASLVGTVDGASQPIPRNVHEFCRDSARAGDAARFAFVSRVPVKRIRRIFAGELDSAILADLLVCFNGVLASGGVAEGYPGTPADARNVIIDVLLVLASVDRFDLTIGLLTKADLVVLGQVLDGLSSADEGSRAADIAALRASYKCG